MARRRRSRKNVQIQVVPVEPRRTPRKKKPKKKAPKAMQLALRSDFSKAILDPFAVRGARVPDGFLVRTGTGYARYYVNNGQPMFNFSTVHTYCLAHFAPIFWVAAKPLTFWSVVSGTGSWFDFTNNTTPTTVDFTKTFGLTAVSENQPIGTGSAFRTTGGGLSLQFFGINENTPIDAYLIPTFNRQGLPSTYPAAAGLAIRHWRVAGDAEIVSPFPIRSKENAFEWTRTGAIGTTYTDYPLDDGLTGATQTHDKLVATASTDCTTTNQTVVGHSLQSGLGSVTIAFRLPPGAGVTCSAILHHEWQPATSYPDSYAGEETTRPELSNEQEMEAVCNAASVLAMVEDSTIVNSDVTPLSELQRMATNTGTQVLRGVNQFVDDTQLVNRLTQAALYGGTAFVANHIRRARMQNPQIAF